MEPNVQPTEGKYQKLATEYSKLRAQASVLRKAVLDEQAKSNSLREQLRQRESALRRSEQEVDSLGFRNKQLEHRVAALQEEIAAHEGRNRPEKDERKRQLGGKSDALQTVTGSVGITRIGDGGKVAQDTVIFEELQKKIMENAQLTSLVDDKEHELLLHADRIVNLEQVLEKRATEFAETEKRLRRDMEALHSRNCELETKLVEAASMLGSEDALSVSGSDHTPLHNTAAHHNHLITSTATHVIISTEERVAGLEKEVVHWRTQYEIAKMNDAFINSGTGIDTMKAQTTSSSAFTLTAPASAEQHNCSCSSAAAGLTVIPSSIEGKSARDSVKEPLVPPTKEQLIYNNFSRKLEDLLKLKCLAESQMQTYETESEHLQICLENATHELKSKDEQIQSINQALQMLEEDLATTRMNYDEQISVLTEQVINLSEQLAACK